MVMIIMALYMAWNYKNVIVQKNVFGLVPGIKEISTENKLKGV
tara:strand:+ start:1633 stop:1761 length:129 start_codon:yes stop_codon:yes gene_type:complete